MSMETLGRSFVLGLSPGMNTIHPQLSPKPCRGSVSRGLLIQARFAVLSNHYEEDCRTYERVLRYPSGQVRRIRYPVVRDEDAAESYSIGPLQSYQEGWDPDKWDNLGWEIVQPSGRVVRTDSSMKPTPPAALEVERPSKKRSELPNSPAELLRHISSEGYRQAQRDLAARVSTSYEVLEGSPWVQSRPLYVLATQQPGREAGMTYTLRTRVSRPQAENELSRVLGKRQSDGSALISVSEMRDGIVTFEDEADAARFASLLSALDADSQAEVMVARADAHELFRASQSVHSVVVLLRAGCHLPQPDQLLAALRSKRSMEDSVDM